jgi:hypothetical protein
MNDPHVDPWFGQYLDTFAACGRGEGDAGSMLEYYGVPLLVSSDAGFLVFTSAEEVLDFAQRQIESMRAVDYAHSEVVDFETSTLNSVARLCQGTFVRRSRDGRDIGRLTATYLVNKTGNGHRISALALHTP